MGNYLLKKGTPIRASARVTCSSLYEPSNNQPAHFNPNSLKQSYKATVGKGSPVGWSQQIKQYSHSEDAPFTLEFYFSANKILALKEGIYPDANQAIPFYNQFLFPRALGEAPPLMLLVWPHTLTMAVCVEQVDTDYSLWDLDLFIRICTITLTVSEMRQEFRTSNDMLNDGFIGGGGISPEGAVAGTYKLGRTGPPLNLGSSGRGAQSRTTPRRR